MRACFIEHRRASRARNLGFFIIFGLGLVHGVRRFGFIRRIVEIIRESDSAVGTVQKRGVIFTALASDGDDKSAKQVRLVTALLPVGQKAKKTS